MDAGPGCGLSGHVFFMLECLFSESEAWRDVWCRAPLLDFKQRLDEGQSFFQMTLTKTVETAIQTLNLLFPILDKRIEKLRTGSNRMMLVTERTFILVLLDILRGRRRSRELDRWFVWSREVRFNSFKNSGLNLQPLLKIKQSR